MGKIDLLTGVPGFRDHYPENWREINFILNNMREVATQFGYEEYEGPSLERVELIEAKSGEGLIKEIFRLTDRFHNNLLLRPEQTPTLARMLAKEQQRYKRPIRWFSIPRLFRDETIQKGRLREFWQLNVDILGEDAIVADAEIIAVGIEIFRACGLQDKDFKILVNHRELLNIYIRSICDIDPIIVIPIVDKRDALVQNEIENQLISKGLKKKEAKELSLLFRRISNSSDAFREKLLKSAEDIISFIDKEEEITRDVMINEYKKVGLDDLSATKLFDLTKINGKSEKFFEQIDNLDLSDKFLQTIDQLKNLSTYLESLGVLEPVIFDISLARGLDYYTGIVFEGFDTTGQIVRALFGGGRYSDLIETIGGNPLSGVGFGMGDVSLMELVKLKYGIPVDESRYDIYLAPIKSSSIPFVLSLSKRLRGSFNILCNPFNWKLKRHFEFVDEIKSKLIIYAGPKDIENNKISVRRECDKSKYEINIDQGLEKELKKILNHSN